MISCKRCFSYAINHHSHGRDGTEKELCDVCYWRQLAEIRLAYLQLLEKNVDILKPRIEQLEAFVNRFLDPEDLGYAVNKCFRDDAREALGRSRVESPSKENKL